MATTTRSALIGALIALAGVALAATVLLIPFGSGKPARAATTSSDPGKIAFTSTRNCVETNCRDLYTMNPDGSGVTPVTTEATGSGEEAGPMLSPDGTKIVFYSLRGPIQVINTDGSGLVDVNPSVTFLGVDPVWSPDGSKIAFVYDVDRNPREGETDIFVVNADGSGQPIRVTNTPSAYKVTPSWSPDGKRIAFSCLRCPGSADAYDIYVTKADGSSTPVQITDTDNIREGQPRWSPDGKKIAYTAEKTCCDTPRDVYVMNADGAGQRPLVASADGREWDPYWSPDGRLLTFTGSGGPYGDDAEVFETGVVDAPADPTNLTDNDISQDYSGSWRLNFAPLLRPLSPAPGSSTADRTPLVSAKVTDLQEELAKSDVTKLSLDGQTVVRSAFSYDPGTDRLSYTPASALSYGRHTARVVTKDSMGATASKAWSFSVVLP